MARANGYPKNWVFGFSSARLSRGREAVSKCSPRCHVIKMAPEELSMAQSNLAVTAANGAATPIEIVPGTKGSPRCSTKSQAAQPEREIDFVSFANGTLIDLVRDSSGELVLAVSKDGKAVLQGKVEERGVIYIPPRLYSSISRVIRFPTGVGVSHTGRELLVEIEDVLDRYFDCDPSDRKLIAHYALYSWVSDLLEVAPCLWVLGPYERERTILLRLMHSICRRPILLGDTSVSTLYEINTAFHPTLLFDESLAGKDSKNPNFLRMLRMGSTRCVITLRGSKAFDLFGPKIIGSREGPGEAALASLGFSVVARPFSKKVLDLSAHAVESITEQLQPKLLAFRLANYVRLKSIANSQLQFEGMSPKTQDMVRALALPVAGDPELERQVLTIVDGFNRQLRSGRDGEPEWFVALALLDLAHTRGPSAAVFWTCGVIGQLVAHMATERGESFEPKARKVGAILRSLGLNTSLLGSRGRGLKRSGELKDKIHQIAKNLGICAGDLLLSEYFDAPVTCELCERYGMNFDCDGRKKKYLPWGGESFPPPDPPE